MYQTSEQSIQRRPAKNGLERPFARGLTRIELVVMLALIALTVRLVLPGVVHTREAARHTVTQDHLRQLGLALRESGGRQIDQGPIVFEASPPAPAETSDTTLFVEALIVLMAATAVLAAALAIRFAIRHVNRQDEPVLDREARPARFLPQPAADSIWIE
jgi:hypothetical protein